MKIGKTTRPLRPGVTRTIPLGLGIAILAAMAVGSRAQNSLTGTVLTMTGQPVPGAVVRIAGKSGQAMTDAQGKYELRVVTTFLKRSEGYTLRMVSEGTRLSINLAKAEEVVIDVYGLSGQLARKVASGVLPGGEHAFELAGLRQANQMYLVMVSLGGQTGWHKMTLQGALSTITATGESAPTEGLAKVASLSAAAASDSIFVTHVGYHGGLANLHGRKVTSLVGVQNFRLFSADKGWDVCAPPFTFKFDQSEGALYYQKLIAGPDATNREVLREVCQAIWVKPGDVPVARRYASYTVNINAKVTTGVASTGGNSLNINVNYINRQKSSGDANAWQEIVGVLVHEAVHSYQPYYNTTGAAGFGEAVPDAIRALTGFFRWPKGAKCTGDYAANYQEGGKYWYFIELKHPGFINKIFKLTSGDISSRVRQVTGASLSSLVSECQTKGMPL